MEKLPLHLPLVSHRALDDYVPRCLLDRGVGPWLVTEDEELRLALDCRQSGDPDPEPMVWEFRGWWEFN